MDKDGVNELINYDIMNKNVVALILAFMSFILISCGSGNSNSSSSHSTEYYTYPAEEHYYTDPKNGLQYSKTSFFNPQYQTKSSNSGVNERYSTGYQEGYEEALSGQKSASYRSSNRSYQAGFEEGYEDAMNGLEAGY